METENRIVATILENRSKECVDFVHARTVAGLKDALESRGWDIKRLIRAEKFSLIIEKA